jgi:hypothetical protein
MENSAWSIATETMLENFEFTLGRKFIRTIGFWSSLFLQNIFTAIFCIEDFGFGRLKTIVNT